MKGAPHATGPSHPYLRWLVWSVSGSGLGFHGGPGLRGLSIYFDDADAITELASAYPNSHVIGCSTAGEIHGTQVSDDSLSVAIVKFDHTEIRTAVTRVSGDSYEAGRMVGTSLADNGLRSIFVLSDGLGDNGSELARGINEHVDESVVVTGGLVGDGADFK